MANNSNAELIARMVAEHRAREMKKAIRAAAVRAGASPDEVEQRVDTASIQFGAYDLPTPESIKTAVEAVRKAKPDLFPGQAPIGRSPVARIKSGELRLTKAMVKTLSPQESAELWASGHMQQALEDGLDD